jgi:dTDP-4-amino-4,6-dideoxygalactose transaminase
LVARDEKEQPAVIPIAKPLLGEAEAEAARRAILSGWTSQGPEVAAFEKEFAAFVGAPHACAVSNCTTALHLALLAVGVRPGDEVITVSHSFIATANCIRYCNATPVFVDIDAATYNIDPALIEAAITGRTRAILCVHQVGMPSSTSPPAMACRWSRTRPAPSAAKSSGTGAGRRSGGRTATSPASPSIRAR